MRLHAHACFRELTHRVIGTVQAEYSIQTANFPTLVQNAAFSVIPGPVRASQSRFRLKAMMPMEVWAVCVVRDGQSFCEGNCCESC